MADDDFAYVTTWGRVSGRPHEIEIWYARRHDTVYLLSGGGHDADWVRNFSAAPEVVLGLGDGDYQGTARVVTDPDEDAIARMLVWAKYHGRSDASLEEWRDRSLPVAIDLVECIELTDDIDLAEDIDLPQNVDLVELDANEQLDQQAS